ncbi:MAG TPA: hypothetical protein VJZ71_06275 [Phycisphaerae bacterium]|nr:hypothetical protein [Phycisphaerae bacterium]
MSNVVRLATVGAFGFVLFAATPRAGADDDCRSSCAEADLDSLCARLDWTGTDWCLSIRYEIELEDVHPRDAFELVLTPLYRGRELVDASEQVVRVSAPLEFRSRCDDDEAELEDEITVRLGETLIEDPFDLRVCGEVICRTSGKVLDDDSTCVKVGRLPPQFVEEVVAYEEPVFEGPPPPPPVPPVVVYRPPPPVVIYRPFVRYRPYYECRPWWRRGSVRIDVDW